MECAAADNAAFYHPRNPRASPLFRLLEEHYAEFERVYPERYQQRYGFWRPVIRKAVLDFLKCGDLREGFARVTSSSPPCDPTQAAQDTAGVCPRQPSPGPVSGSPGALPPSGPALACLPARPGPAAGPGRAGRTAFPPSLAFPTSADYVSLVTRRKQFPISYTLTARCQ